DTTRFTVGVRRALIGTGVEGRQSAKGNEEDLRTSELDLYANSWGHAVPTETYGIDYVRQNAIKIYKAAQPELSRWGGQMIGMKKRQALNEVYSYEQTAAPVGRTLGLNANFYAMGSTGFVARGSDLATYVGNIGTTVALVNDTPASYDTDINNINLLAELAQTVKQIEPLTIGGDECYLLLLPMNQWRKLYDTGAGSYTDLAKYDNSGKIINGMQAFKYSNMIIMGDPRFSVASTTAGSDLQFSYKGPNLTPTGTNLAKTANVGYLLGKGALYEMKNEDLHFEEDVDNYGRDRGIGMFCTKSYTLTQFLDGTGFVSGTNYNSTDLYNRNSIVILFGKN
ncbi:MAG: hypothetical protein ACKVJC_08530, partial [Flavobacteriales bacterium]